MDKKATDILSYLTIIGWLIAWCTGNKEESRVALQQGFTLGAASIVIAAIKWFCGFLGLLGVILSIVCWIISVVIAVLVIMGLINAVKGEDKLLPLIYNFNFLKI